jgi:hypothetical protein
MGTTSTSFSQVQHRLDVVDSHTYLYFWRHPFPASQLQIDIHPCVNHLTTYLAYPRAIYSALPFAVPGGLDQGFTMSLI